MEGHIINLTELFKKFMETQHKKRGRKIADLDLEDRTTHAILNQKSKELSIKKAGLELETKEFDLMCQKWHHGLIKKYKLKHDICFEVGTDDDLAIYELETNLKTKE